MECGAAPEIRRHSPAVFGVAFKQTTHFFVLLVQTLVVHLQFANLYQRRWQRRDLVGCVPCVSSRIISGHSVTRQNGKHTQCRLQLCHGGFKLAGRDFKLGEEKLWKNGVRYLLNVKLPFLSVSRLGLCISTALWLAIV